MKLLSVFCSNVEYCFAESDKTLTKMFNIVCNHWITSKTTLFQSCNSQQREKKQRF